MKQMMKTILLGFFLAIGLAGPLKAQVVVTDPLSRATSITNSLEQIAQQSALIDQGAKEFKALYNTGVAIKSFAISVNRTYETFKLICSIANEASQSLDKAEYLTVAEKLAISKGYESILRQTNDIITRLMEFKKEMSSNVPLLDQFTFWDDSLDDVGRLGLQLQALTASWKLANAERHKSSMDEWCRRMVLGR